MIDLGMSAIGGFVRLCKVRFLRIVLKNSVFGSSREHFWPHRSSSCIWRRGRPKPIFGLAVPPHVLGAVFQSDFRAPPEVGGKSTFSQTGVFQHYLRKAAVVGDRSEGRFPAPSRRNVLGAALDIQCSWPTFGCCVQKGQVWRGRHRSAAPRPAYSRSAARPLIRSICLWSKMGDNLLSSTAGAYALSSGARLQMANTGFRKWFLHPSSVHSAR